MVISNPSFTYNDQIDTAVFQIADTACFLWEEMDDAHVIYDKRSGYSQVLNNFAYEIFDVIGEKPRRLCEVTAELQTILERPLGPELSQQVRQTIIEFDKMGLIEPLRK